MPEDVKVCVWPLVQPGDSAGASVLDELLRQAGRREERVAGPRMALAAVARPLSLVLASTQARLHNDHHAQRTPASPPSPHLLVAPSPPPIPLPFSALPPPGSPQASTATHAMFAAPQAAPQGQAAVSLVDGRETDAPVRTALALARPRATLTCRLS